MIQFLFTLGNVLEVRDEDGMTALMQSVFMYRDGHVRGWLPIFKFLMEQHPNLEDVDRFGDTVVFDAVGNPNLEFLTDLIAAGANINHADVHGNTPLIEACIGGFTEAVRCLLGPGNGPNGCDLDHVDATGDSAIHTALKRGHVAIVKMLCDKGASLDQEDEDGRTSLEIAVDRGDPVLINVIRDAIDARLLAQPV